MKRLALVAAVLAVAACGKKEEAPAVDTTAMTPAPAPAVTTPDTTVKVDTSVKIDTTKKADTTHKM